MEECYDDRSEDAMNINYRVVNLDPGGTTGWFQYDAEFEPVVEVGQRPKLLDWKTTHLHFGPGEHHSELYAALEHAHIHNFFLVCESFEYRNDDHRDNLNLMSKEYIGVAKLFRDERLGGRGSRRFFMQTAGEAKGFVPDKAKNGLPANAKLRAIPGFYKASMKHANDAARHGAYFLVNRQGRTDLIRGWQNL
jgi:hypothetical protein